MLETLLGSCNAVFLLAVCQKVHCSGGSFRDGLIVLLCWLSKSQDERESRKAKKKWVLIVGCRACCQLYWRGVSLIYRPTEFIWLGIKMSHRRQRGWKELDISFSLYLLIIGYLVCIRINHILFALTWQTEHSTLTPSNVYHWPFHNRATPVLALWLVWLVGV